MISAVRIQSLGRKLLDKLRVQRHRKALKKVEESLDNRPVLYSLLRALSDAELGDLPQPVSLIVTAASLGLPEALKILLMDEAECSLPDGSGCSALDRAAQRGHRSCVRILLANKHYSGVDGGQALVFASQRGNVAMVKLLLQNGVSATARGAENVSGLHPAAYLGYSQVLLCLIRAGGDVSGPDLRGRTPCHAAIQGHQEKCLEILLREGTNVRARDNLGREPLNMAAEFQASRGAISAIAEKGGSVSAPDIHGLTPLHIASAKADLEQLSAFLSLGADPRAVDKLHRSSLHLAVLECEDAVCVPVAKALVEHLRAGSGDPPGKFESLKRLLLDLPDGEGMTALMYGAALNKPLLVQFLLQNGASVNCVDNRGWSALTWARFVEAGRACVLLEDAGGSDDHVTNPRLSSRAIDPSTLARSRKADGQFPSLRDMVEGVSQSPVSDDDDALFLQSESGSGELDDDQSPLDDAVSSDGERGSIRQLIRPDSRAEDLADYQRRRAQAERAIALAEMSQNEALLEMRKLRNQAELGDVRSQGEQVAVHEREQLIRQLHESTRENDPEALQSVLVEISKRDISVDEPPSKWNNQTALHVAAMRNHLTAAKLLVDAGASPRCLDVSGSSPLHYACAEGNLPMVKLFLLKGGRDMVNRCNKVEECSPLHIAARFEKPLVAAFLLSRGAMRGIIDKHGRTALQVAQLYKAKKCVKVITRSDKDCSLFHAAIRTHFQDHVTKYLKKRRELVWSADYSGNCAIHTAALADNTLAVRVLLDAGADIEDRNSHGRTALHVAAERGNINCMELLLSKGAMPSASDHEGMTPLHLAAGARQLLAIKLLILWGAAIDATSHVGFTPLHRAAEAGSLPILKLLIKEGANPHAVVDGGFTALRIARENERTECELYLTSKVEERSADAVAPHQDRLLERRGPHRPGFGGRPKSRASPRGVNAGTSTDALDVVATPPKVGKTLQARDPSPPGRTRKLPPPSRSAAAVRAQRPSSAYNAAVVPPVRPPSSVGSVRVSQPSTSAPASSRLGHQETKPFPPAPMSTKDFQSVLDHLKLQALNYV